MAEGNTFSAAGNGTINIEQSPLGMRVRAIPILATCLRQELAARLLGLVRIAPRHVTMFLALIVMFIVLVCVVRVALVLACGSLGSIRRMRSTVLSLMDMFPLFLFFSGHLPMFLGAVGVVALLAIAGTNTVIPAPTHHLGTARRRGTWGRRRASASRWTLRLTFALSLALVTVRVFLILGMLRSTKF